MTTTTPRFTMTELQNKIQELKDKIILAANAEGKRVIFPIDDDIYPMLIEITYQEINKKTNKPGKMKIFSADWHNLN